VITGRLRRRRLWLDGRGYARGPAQRLQRGAMLLAGDVDADLLWAVEGGGEGQRARVRARAARARAPNCAMFQRPAHSS
jgi:hypothetical protein